MFKNLVLALFAAVLLAGCSSSAGRSGAGKYEDNNKHIVEFEREIGDRVFFALGKDTLSAQSKASLMRQAEWLKEHKLFSITVEGHCDERGTRELNIALGERRAERVKAFLVEQGVDADRIDTISYGKERPAVIGNDEAAWSQNRRAVTAIR